jgi:DNA-binding SARP family transcriptional activator
MFFGLLGPLCVRQDQKESAIAGVRQRILLAGMLVRAGRAVSQDELGELVWDGAPPPAAHVTLRSYIARLRRALGPEAGARVITRSPGYLIEAHEPEVDYLQFSRLCREGAASMRALCWQQASDQLDSALSLWRGAPLADVPCRALQQSEVPRLEELRLQALEQQLCANLHLGKHAEIIGELLQLAAAYPLREGLRELLMLALYRASRQADALLVFSQTRRTFVNELGIEPGAQLRKIHQQILAHDPALEAHEPQASLSFRSEPLPRHFAEARTIRRSAPS